MPKIDFYTLRQPGEEARRLFACRLAEKAFGLGHRIYLHVESREAAEDLDDLLWKFKPESFLPHAIDEQADEDDDVPVIIGFSDTCESPRDVMINLGRDIPAFHRDFRRIAEIVSSDDKTRRVCRERWREYKGQGFEVENHNV